jgi:hypothetical protein
VARGSGLHRPDNRRISSMLTRVDFGHIRSNSAGNGRITSAGSASHRTKCSGGNNAGEPERLTRHASHAHGSRPANRAQAAVRISWRQIGNYVFPSPTFCLVCFPLFQRSECKTMPGATSRG